jgi:hypothetical protein
MSSLLRDRARRLDLPAAGIVCAAALVSTEALINSA